MSKRYFFPIFGTSKTHLQILPSFCPPQTPKKRENPTRLKDFWGGSAAGARPRVAKAMLSFPTLHGEASPEFKRLRATAGQGPNYVGPFCGYAGLCWPMLAYLAGNVGPSCGYVGLMLIHVEPKDPKNGNSKKNTVKRRIF